MLDDKDEFVVEWLHYRCPGCGGYREDGCATCAEYNFFYDLIVHQDKGRDAIFEIQEIHDEVLRRMQVAA